EHKACAGIGDLDAVPARLEDVKKKGLLHGVLMRSGFDRDAGFEKDIGRAKNILAAVERISDVVEAPFHAMRLLRVGEVVALIRCREPHARFLARIEHDLLGEAKAEIFLKELSIGAHIHGEAIEMIEPSHIDTARRKPLSLVLQRRPQRLWRLIPLRLVVKLDDMPVRVVETIGGAVPQFALMPADGGAATLERLHAPLQRLRAARPKGRMTE